MYYYQKHEQASEGTVDFCRLHSRRKVCHGESVPVATPARRVRQGRSREHLRPRKAEQCHGKGGRRPRGASRCSTSGRRQWRSKRRAAEQALRARAAQRPRAPLAASRPPHAAMRHQRLLGLLTSAKGAALIFSSQFAEVRTTVSGSSSLCDAADWMLRRHRPISSRSAARRHTAGRCRPQITAFMPAFVVCSSARQPLAAWYR